MAKMPEIEQVCPNCGEIYKAPSEWIGGKVECPACKTTFTVVGTTAQAPSGKTPSFWLFVTGLAVLIMLGIATFTVFLLRGSSFFSGTAGSATGGLGPSRMTRAKSSEPIPEKRPRDGRDRLLTLQDLVKTGRETRQFSKEPAEVYKGIWLPGMTPNYLASNIQKMKNMGMNIVSLAVMFLEKDGDRLAGIDTSHIVADIQTVHENGMKVMLNPQFYPQPRLEEIDVEKLNALIIEVTKLAEEYDVELFAPLGEADVIFHPNIGQWRQEILPKIKKVYHGETFWSGPEVGLPDKPLSEQFLKELSKAPPGDFLGYDYRGFSIFYVPKESLTPEEQSRYADKLTLEGYSQYVDNVLKYVLALAERDNCKVMITEFGVMGRFFLTESGVLDKLEEGSWISREEHARAYEIVLEKGKDKVDGFIAYNFLGGEVPGMPGVYVKGAPKTVDVIGRWFK